MIFYGDWVIPEIQFKYEKLKSYDQLNASMELVSQKFKNEASKGFINLLNLLCRNLAFEPYRLLPCYFW